MYSITLHISHRLQAYCSDDVSTCQSVTWSYVSNSHLCTCRVPSSVHAAANRNDSPTSRCPRHMSCNTTLSLFSSLSRQNKIMENTPADQATLRPDLTVGWIGLGSMGLAMAINVQKHLKSNHSTNLRYWNRTISKGQELRDMGGEPCEHPADVPRNCDVTFISVSRACPSQPEQC